MGQTFVTAANNQLTNVVFLWEYDWVLFVVRQYNCFLQPAGVHKPAGAGLQPDLQPGLQLDLQPAGLHKPAGAL